MRTYPIEKYRNTGIIAHISAGKTTTSTCILYHTGKVHKIGTLEKGTTPLDWMVQSQERAMTIMAAATTTYWKVDGEEYQINIIDNPNTYLIASTQAMFILRPDTHTERNQQCHYHFVWFYYSCVLW